MARLILVPGVCIVLVLSSTLAAAQSNGAVAGVIRDTSGGVLPGATVEAASPALIEQVRSGVSDGQGRYQIIELPPGTYSVTVTLPGFSTYVREGIELSAGFTANVSAELSVGSVEETITVTGATPIVDVQNARTQRVLRADVLNALPSGTRSLTKIASMTLGAVNSSRGVSDVGGDKGESATGIRIHGNRAADGKANWDGMSTNTATSTSGGQMRIYYFNTVAMQEVTLDTGGNSAESETGGANINFVPREGSNTFSLYSTANYTSDRYAAKSIPDSLVDRGVSPQSGLKGTYDYGVGAGGPLRKDKLWFYATTRWWGSQSVPSSNFFDKSTNPWVYVPDLDRPAYADSFYVDSSFRATWQIAEKHKLSQEEHLEHGCNCWLAIGYGARVSPDAATDYTRGPQILSQTTYTYVPTNRLLIQAGALFLRQHSNFTNGGAPDASKFTGRQPILHPGPGDFSVNELTTGYRWGALPGRFTNYGYDNDNNVYNQHVTVSYVTGSHAFKTGLQVNSLNWGSFGMQTPNQVTFSLRGGVPSALQQYAGPFQSIARIRGIGLFAQDQWTLDRLTLNLGFRFDRFAGRTLAQDIPAGPFREAFQVDEVSNLPNFKDFVPRIGVAYDLFGDGKTAIKATWGRYLAGQGAALASRYAPSSSIVQNVSRTWNDNSFPAGDARNGNFAPDCDLSLLTANGECGGVNNRLFGQSFTNRLLADDARQGWGQREYSYQIGLELQHELRPGLGVAVGYHRTWYRNQLVTQNTAVSPSDFTEYCITTPTDPRLGQLSGNPVCGFYDVNPDKFGQQSFLLEQASNYGTPEEFYNGVDMRIDARWGDGALLVGGVSVGRNTADWCYANGHPELNPQGFPNPRGGQYPRNDDYCRATSSWWDGIGSQVKLQFVYPLPADFAVSVAYQNLPGVNHTANFVLRNAQVAPLLDRNLSGCPATGTCTATRTHAIVPVVQNGNDSNTQGGPLTDFRLNQTDIRVSKVFRVGRLELEGMLDLYNAFNNRAPLNIVTTYGGAWSRPSLLLGGRLLKFGTQIRF